jgi:hypothetical protein
VAVSPQPNKAAVLTSPQTFHAMLSMLSMLLTA